MKARHISGIWKWLAARRHATFVARFRRWVRERLTDLEELHTQVTLEMGKAARDWCRQHPHFRSREEAAAAWWTAEGDEGEKLKDALNHLDAEKAQLRTLLKTLGGDPEESAQEGFSRAMFAETGHLHLLQPHGAEAQTRQVMPQRTTPRTGKRTSRRRGGGSGARAPGGSDDGDGGDGESDSDSGVDNFAFALQKRMLAHVLCAASAFFVSRRGGGVR